MLQDISSNNLLVADEPGGACRLLPADPSMAGFIREMASSSRCVQLQYLQCLHGGDQQQQQAAAASSSSSRMGRCTARRYEPPTFEAANICPCPLPLPLLLPLPRCRAHNICSTWYWGSLTTRNRQFDPLADLYSLSFTFLEVSRAGRLVSVLAGRQAGAAGR
jgi:hypothetical protein